MTPLMGRSLGGVNHRLVCPLTLKQPRRLQDVILCYPHWGGAIQVAGMEIVEEYVLKRHNTVAQYISVRKIMDLCEEAVRRPGA